MHVIVATDGSKQSLAAAKHLKAFADPKKVTEISVIAVVRPLAAVAFADAQKLDHLDRAIASRDLIGQAKGMLMVTHQLDADAGFELLRRHSQNTNTKVHDLAAHLVSQAATLEFDETIPAQVDVLLQQPRH